MLRNFKVLLLSTALFAMQGCGSKKAPTAEATEVEKTNIEVYGDDNGMFSAHLDGFNVEHKGTADLSEETKEKLGLNDNDHVTILVKRGELQEAEVNYDMSDTCDEFVVTKFKIKHLPDSSEIADTKENNDVFAALTAYNFDENGEVLPIVQNNKRFFKIEANSNKTGRATWDETLRNERAGVVRTELMNYGLRDEALKVTTPDASVQFADTTTEDHMFTTIYVMECKNTGTVTKKKDNVMQDLEQLCKVKPQDVDLEFEPNQVDIEAHHIKAIEEVTEYLHNIHKAEEKIKAEGHELVEPNRTIMSFDVYGNKTDNEMFAQAQAAERAANYKEAIKTVLTTDKYGLSDDQAEALINRVELNLKGDQYKRKEKENSLAIVQNPEKYGIEFDNEEEVEEEGFLEDSTEDNAEEKEQAVGEENEENEETEEEREEEGEEEEF